MRLSASENNFARAQRQPALLLVIMAVHCKKLFSFQP